MKVNLSRLHNMLKQLAADIRTKHSQAMRPLANASNDFSFKIFEGTTDADIKEFLGKIKNKKQQTEALFEDTRKIISYCGYIRRQLDTYNHQNGVSAKLVELDILQKNTANLEKIRDIMDMSCSENLDPVKGADYYKTSFTDKQKVYDLTVKMFSEQDRQTIETEIEEQEKAANDLKDEIAMINQTTVVDILTFKEYSAKTE